jgi:hypothetical protein
MERPEAQDAGTIILTGLILILLLILLIPQLKSINYENIRIM